eukprot:444029_1
MSNADTVLRCPLPVMSKTTSGDKRTIRYPPVHKRTIRYPYSSSSSLLCPPPRKRQKPNQPTAINRQPMDNTYSVPHSHSWHFNSGISKHVSLPYKLKQRKCINRNNNTSIDSVTQSIAAHDCLIGCIIESASKYKNTQSRLPQDVVDLTANDEPDPVHMVPDSWFRLHANPLEDTAPQAPSHMYHLHDRDVTTTNSSVPMPRQCVANQANAVSMPRQYVQNQYCNDRYQPSEAPSIDTTILNDNDMQMGPFGNDVATGDMDFGNVFVILYKS